MQLRVRGERAVLVGFLDTDRPEVDPRELTLAPELSDALHEWARVAAAVRRARGDDAGKRAPNPETAVVVSRRGHKLAGLVAAQLGVPVDYLDPVTETATTVAPRPRSTAARAADRTWGRAWRASAADLGEPTPWGTGLTVAGFMAAVVIVAMIALAGALSSEAGGWVAIAAAAVVTAGLAPSLWLLRRLPIVRWIVLGAAAGVALSWGGVLVIAF